MPRSSSAGAQAAPLSTQQRDDRSERWLWRIRLIAILPVLFSLASPGVTFVLGIHEIGMAILGLGRLHNAPKTFMATMLGGVVAGAGHRRW